MDYKVFTTVLVKLDETLNDLVEDYQRKAKKITGEKPTKNEVIVKATQIGIKKLLKD